MDFSVIKKAKLTQQEFADLCCVSRVTVNLWATAKMAPHMYIREEISDIVASLTKAVKDGRLPLPAETPKEQRLEALQAVLGASQGALNT
jgi:transcriptional regulator with XRE-family HTH domain